MKEVITSEGEIMSDGVKLVDTLETVQHMAEDIIKIREKYLKERDEAKQAYSDKIKEVLRSSSR